ncbi:MAG: ADOP family duplicated permease [Pseudomonadales bacterium]|nr:ADOP family duplicated permease [Pseudomonadales bacterium]
MAELLRDLAFAWRNALKQPGTALLIVVTLALGIGLNSAVFSVTWRVLLAPLPYTDSDRLVLIEQNKPVAGRSNVRWSGPTIDDLRAMSTALVDVASYEQQEHTIVGRGDPQFGTIGMASWNWFPLLGVHVQLGRDFSRADDSTDTEPVMLLSQEFWRSKFGSDPAAVGATLELAGVVYRIVGVLPSLPAWPHVNDAWVTEGGDPYRAYNLTHTYDVRSAEGLGLSHVISRLRDGATSMELEQDLAAVAQRLTAAYPDVYRADYSLAAKSVEEALVRESRATFMLLAGLAMLVVLVACANVASLNLTRFALRNQELAIREAVGAAPGRIMRQLLTESLLFALAGTLLGLLVAWPVLNLLTEFASGYSPLAGAIRFDYALLLFALGTALVAAVVSGLAPSFGRRQLNDTLKENGAKATLSSAGMRFRKALVLLQFALAFVVLTSAGLILRSLFHLDDQEAGYDDAGVLALSVPLNLDLSATDYPPLMLSFGRQLLEQVEALPGVISAGIYTGPPMLQNAAFAMSVPIFIEDRDSADRDQNPLATIRVVSEDYFETLGIALLGGRMFTRDDDKEAAPVAIVNASAARLFPDGKVIGHHVRVEPSEEWREVVGVVDEVRASNLDSMEGPVLYNSFWQWPTETQNLYVKTAADPRTLTTAITTIVHGINPAQSLATLKPLSELKQEWLAPARLRAVLIGFSGLLALSLTLAGVIGVIGCGVSQRVREIGIRMAVGATPTQVTQLFLAGGLVLCIGGILLGLALMLAAAPLLQPLLYEISARDVGVYVGSAALLLLAALIASGLPAGRAGLLNPMEALHAE